MMAQILDQIEKALDSVRPYLEADGGNVSVVELSEDMILKVEFQGACGSCPMSTMTFKAGIEEAIRKAVPEVKEVVAINLTTA